MKTNQMKMIWISKLSMNHRTVGTILMEMMDKKEDKRQESIGTRRLKLECISSKNRH